MRLTTVLLFTACLHVAANTEGQNITLNVKDAPVKEVFREIQKQTGLNVMMDEALIEKLKAITLNVHDAPVSEVLKICFQNESLSYTIEDGRIIVKSVSPNSPHPIVANVEPPGDIHGHVTDSAGHPLAGASITIKGTQTGTTTDVNGNFALAGVKDNATLLISYTGYAKQQYKLKGQTSISIALIPYISELDKVQVIAYGTTTQRVYTGDVTTVKGADIEKQPVGNALLALEGRVPGLEISQSSGLSGGNVNVLIRGGTSIANRNNPFYVVDGVPYPSQLLPNLGGSLYNSSQYGPTYNPTAGIFGQNPAYSTFGNPLNYLNPSDIESISVLKDAVATSIYGSQAANGAIIITTKHGKAGDTKVDINVQNGWGGITRKLDLMNPQQYLAMRHEALKNDGSSIGPSDYDLNGTWDTTHITDWQKTLIGGTSQYLNIGVTVSGGNAFTQYTVGGNLHRETSVFPDNFANQDGSFHFNINSQSSNRKFGLILTGNYMVDDNRLPTTDLTNQSIIIPPVAPPLYTPDGQLNWAPNNSGSSTWYNPLAFLYNKYENKTNSLISNLILSYHILPELEIRCSFGYSNFQANEVVTYPLIANYPEARPTYSNSALYGNNNSNDWIVEPQINYKHKIGKGSLETLIGATIHQNNSRGVQLVGVGYNSDQVLDDIASAAVVRIQSTIDAVYKYSALFGRIDYNWNEKYIVDLTARRDGSSRFGAANQFHNFGALGFAWIFSQESFIKENWRFISFGKLRGSYGTTGNDQIPDYQFLNLYGAIPTTNPYQGVRGLGPAGLTNPYLEWEETRKLEFGADLGLMKDRILLGGSYYRNRSSNQLLPYSLPIITGFTSVTQNFPATIQNSGWEFSLHTENIKQKDFEWSTSINLSLPKSKLVAFPNLATSGYAYTLVIGEPTNIGHMYHFLGVDPASGIYQFSDGKGGTTSTPETHYPMTATSLVNLNPTYYGGIGNSFRYKGFELDFFFQFVKQIGQNYFFGTLIPGALGGGTSNQPNYLINRWQQPGMIADHQRYNSNYSLFGPYLDALQSDAAFSDASFIRLKNLSISYSLSATWIKKAHLRNLKFYVRGQNLLTITHYMGLDPETRSFSTLPPLSVLTAGLQVGL